MSFESDYDYLMVIARYYKIDEMEDKLKSLKNQYELDMASEHEAGYDLGLKDGMCAENEE